MSEEPKSSTNEVMVESGPSTNEDEIVLLELIRTLLASWKGIVSTTIIFIGLAVTYALYALESFKAGILLASAQESSSTSPTLSQFGVLAAMAGITIPSSSKCGTVLGNFRIERVPEEIYF